MNSSFMSLIPSTDRQTTPREFSLKKKNNNKKTPSDNEQRNLEVFGKNDRNDINKNLTPIHH